MTQIPDAAARELICSDRTHHLLVEANPGAGKTTILIEKLLREMDPVGGCAPREIVAVTFTRAAAAELRTRLVDGVIARMTGAEPAARQGWLQRLHELDEMLVGTIDQFIHDLLGRYCPLVGQRVAEQHVADSMLRTWAHDEARRQIAETTNRAGVRAALTQLGLAGLAEWVATAVTRVDLRAVLHRQVRRPDVPVDTADPIAVADQTAQRLERDLAQLILDTAAVVEQRCAEQGVRDFGLSLMDALRLAREPAVLRAFQQRVRLLCVDEHQDSSWLQYELFRRLVSLTEAPGLTPPATRLVLVGDAQQSIYQFRGADVRQWHRARQDITAARGEVVQLTTTFRAHPSLVAAINATAGTVLRDQGGDQASPYDVDGAPMVAARDALPDTFRPVRLVDVPEMGPAATATAVANQLAEWLQQDTALMIPDGEGGMRPVEPRDIAVLAPTLRTAGPLLQRACVDLGIPVRMVGGGGLYARAEVQALCATLQATMSDDPQDLLAWLTGPLTRISHETLTLAHARVQAGDFPSLRHALLAAPTWAPETAAAVLGFQMARRQQWRTLVDRMPHGALARRMLDELGAWDVVAQQADGVTATRNLLKVIELLDLPPFRHVPLLEVLDRLAAVMEQREHEDEASVYAPTDNVVTLSTIHGAKGLEWPVVLLTGQDEFLHRGHFGPPALIADIESGVVVPYTLRVETDADDVIVSDLPRVLEHRARDRARSVAEAKRRWFVAQTRARELLVVVAPFRVDRYASKLNPRDLQGEPDKRGWDNPLRWWRHLLPGLGTQPHPEVVLRIDGGDLVVPVTAVPAPRPLPRQVVRAARPEQVPAQLGPVRAAAANRRRMSATELMLRDRCDWLAHFVFEQHISSPTLDVVQEDAMVNRISAAQRGTIVHDALREAATLAPAEQGAALDRVLRRHLSLPDAELASSRAALQPHLDTVLRSPWWAKMEAAVRSYAEVPIVATLPGGHILDLVIDRLWQDADGLWHLLDFKTQLQRGVKDTATAAAMNAQDYRAQVAAYIVGLRQVLGPDARFGDFVFLFTGLNESIAIEISPAEEAGAMRLLGKLLDGVGVRSLTPTWKPRHCGSCALRHVCPVQPPPDLSVAEVEVEAHREAATSMAS
jgi:ATP-dependent exoDNAse (exonuclease V) beta subunit